MQIDQTTLNDLSIFHSSDEYSLFGRLDLTRTLGGRSQLLHLFHHPFGSLARILETQQILKIIDSNDKDWGPEITNGTVMVMERFYETPLDKIPATYDPASAAMYQLLHKADYSLTRYSIVHFADFMRGMQSIASVIDRQEQVPPLLFKLNEQVKKFLNQDLVRTLSERKPGKKFTPTEVIQFGYFIRSHFKNAAAELILIYNQFDAWYSMALASRKFNLVFPECIESDSPYFDATDLFHLLLPRAVSCDVHMDRDKNFIFLTGANMAGKSTFIRSVGCSLFLAHLGMGVPAKKMTISLFDGMLSNINIADNLAMGESYFFNEVQRIRATLLRIGDRKKWLVLVDELFKGTNVQDAMKCSTAVINGLLRLSSSLFVLSTHLYEIGGEFQAFPNVIYKYFETGVSNDQLEFTYQLKDGISNDRLGYLILKREGVVDLLDKL